MLAGAADTAAASADGQVRNAVVRLIFRDIKYIINDQSAYRGIQQTPLGGESSFWTAGSPGQQN